MAYKKPKLEHQDADLYGEDLVNLVNTPASQKTPVNQQTMAAPVAAPPPPITAPTGHWEGSGDNMQWIENKAAIPVNKGSVFGTSETT